MTFCRFDFFFSIQNGKNRYSRVYSIVIFWIHSILCFLLDPNKYWCSIAFTCDNIFVTYFIHWNILSWDFALEVIHWSCAMQPMSIICSYSNIIQLPKCSNSLLRWIQFSCMKYETNVNVTDCGTYSYSCQYVWNYGIFW